MIWTIVLVGLGVTATWTAAKHWWGWALDVVTEVLWFVYALQIGAPPLAIMAVVWAFVKLRNTKVTFKLQNPPR